MKIFVCLNLTPEQLHRLQGSMADHELHYAPDAEDNPKARAVFDRCDIVFGNPPVDWVAQNTGLSWVQLESVGFGEYVALNWPVLSKRLKITNLAGFFSDPVAESILAGILALYRGISRLSVLQTQKHWVGEKLRPSFRSLRGVNVVLFGKGDINRRVEELLAPFHCTITRFGRDWRASDLHDGLATADVVICTVPDSPATRNVFDRAMIARIKTGSILANFGRGSLIDETALIEAVQNGRLGGAVIDVTQEEPLPLDHRFWTCPQILLTQHTGGGAHDEIDRKIDFFIGNLKRYQSNLPLHSLVDFTKVK